MRLVSYILAHVLVYIACYGYIYCVTLVCAMCDRYWCTFSVIRLISCTTAGIYIGTYISMSIHMFTKRGLASGDLSKKNMWHIVTYQVVTYRLAFTWVDSHLCETFMWVFKISDLWWHLEMLHIDSRLCFTLLYRKSEKREIVKTASSWINSFYKVC